MPVLAYILAKVKPGTSNDLVGSRKIRGVKMANSVFGRYDAVLVIAAKDLDELSKTLYEVVETHPNVEHTECLLSLPFPSEPKQPIHSEKYSVISFMCPSCNQLNEQGSVFCQFCGYLFAGPKEAAKKASGERNVDQQVS